LGLAAFLISLLLIYNIIARRGCLDGKSLCFLSSSEGDGGQQKYFFTVGGVKARTHGASARTESKSYLFWNSKVIYLFVFIICVMSGVDGEDGWMVGADDGGKEKCFGVILGNE
jgi:hypothetical protein